MGNSKWGILVGVVCVFAGLAGLLLVQSEPGRKQSSEGTNVAGGESNDADVITTGEGIMRQGILLGEVVQREQVTILASDKALKPYGTHLDANGIRTIMTSEYTEKTPIVELYFMERDTGEDVKPLWLQSVNVGRDDGWALGSFWMEGRVLRLGVGQDPNNHRSLLRGRGYYIHGYTPMGKGLVHGLGPKFTVPETLGDGEIYRVGLLIKDEVLEQEQLEAEKALARQRREKAEREKIVIYVRQYPEPNSRLIGLYSDGQKLREFRDEEEGIMILGGPNKLGGDLMVGVAPRGRPVITTLRPWIYIENLQKRELTAPDEADRVVSKDELVDIKILLGDGQDELANWLKKIFFFPYRQAKVPLFCVLIGEQNRTDRGYVIHMSILPEAYYLVGFIFDGQVEKRIPLGRLEITTQPGKAYTVELQAEPKAALQK
ncbi:MAG: hypothetical protein ACYTBJ_23905 [Planctomycetota bacterium]|jgi:hypothetical protein